MDTYEVLIVDDDEANTDLVKRHFKQNSSIQVYTANNAKEAMNVIRRTFLHLAIVDMQLSKNVPDGMGVFNFLRNERPSCKAILLTAFPDTYRKELFVLLNPLFRQIHSAIDKYDFSNHATTVIERLAAEWLSNQKTVNGVGDIASLLELKTAGGQVNVTANEIDFILSSLMGQGMDSNNGKRVDVGQDLLMSTIDLRELEGGRSRSIVTAGRPIDNAGNLGIWCVMKIGPRQEIEQEYSRYCFYVRYSVALDHRVELLSHIFADTMGAICYSFAGKSPDTVRSLYEIFKTGQDAKQFLHQMFSLESRELYGRRGGTRDLASYFNETYALDPRNIEQSVREFVKRLKHEVVSSAVLEDPNRLNAENICRAFTNTVMREPLETCIVHGDMNANNVVVAEDGRVMYVDYIRAGCGPRAVDFAALEASLRLATCPDTISGVMAEAKKEEHVWQGRWKPSHQRPPEDTYWGKISGVIMGYAMLNFPDLREDEYAATSLLWGARLFRVTQLATVERLRILLWMNQCAKRIITLRS